MYLVTGNGYVGPVIFYADGQLYSLIDGDFTADAQLSLYVGSGLSMNIDGYLMPTDIFDSYSTRIRSLWRSKQDNILRTFRDVATIHFNPIASGTENYDSFFGESTDPTDTDDYTKTTPTPSGIYGRFHSDLYGISISGNERQDIIDAGKFQKGDALFTTTLSQVQIDSSDISKGTLFDNCNYVEVNGYPHRYRVKSVEYRGLGGAYIVDAFLEITNKT